MNQERIKYYLIALSRKLASVLDDLGDEYPTSAEIDEAFVQVVVCFSFLTYNLFEDYGLFYKTPEALRSAKFQRLYPQIECDIDEMICLLQHE